MRSTFFKRYTLTHARNFDYNARSFFYQQFAMASLVATPGYGAERERERGGGSGGRQQRTTQTHEIFVALYSNVYFVDIPRCHFLANASLLVLSIRFSFYYFCRFSFLLVRVMMLSFLRHDPLVKQFQWHGEREEQKHLMRTHFSFSMPNTKRAKE